MGNIFQNMSGQPVIDEATRKLTAAVRQGDDLLVRTRIECDQCGAGGSKGTIVLPNGMRVGSLAVHTLAYHRDSVPAEELSAILALDFGEAEPDKRELHEPR